MEVQGRQRTGEAPMMRQGATTLLAVAIAALAGQPKGKAPAQHPGAPKGRLAWTRVFDGKTLKGWTDEGRGLWSVEDGCIVGRQDPKTHSESWLLSEREWGDFILIVSFEISQGGNSGVFFRAPKVRGHPGRMGLEVQIHAGDTRYPTGSIYDLADAAKGLQTSGWNRLILCAVGNSLFTAVNGRLGAVAEAPRARSRRGRIGFQVHGGIRHSKMAVRFKDIWVAPVRAPAEPPGGLRFRKIVLDRGAHEAAAAFDVDRDGKPDVVCGPSWYRNSVWKAYPLRETSDLSRWELPLDINGDGRMDVIAGGGEALADYWFENPGRPGRLWPFHKFRERKGPVFDMLLTDLDSDGRVNDLLPNGPGTHHWVRIIPGRVPKFTDHRIGGRGKGHGIGAGDVNRDGRPDLVTPDGWYEQPERATRSSWKWHKEFTLRGHPSVPIRVHDVNGDGAADIVYGDAHGYGLWWLEQHAADDGTRTWTEHAIDDVIAQAHSIAIGDLNGDGRADLVAGKRWMAADGDDPGDLEPTCLFWLEHDGTGKNWRRHVIDFNGGAGCGTGLQLADLDGDKDLDIVAPGKGGLYIFLNEGPIR